MRLLGLFFLIIFPLWSPVFAAVDLSQLRLPEGFHITIYADKVPNARAMALGKKGTVFVGSRSAGKVYALVDANRDHHAARVVVLDKSLNMPTGVAFHDGNLYVAAVNRILRYDGIEERLDNPPQAVTVSDSYPENSHHGWKFIAFGPDGKLYVPVGAPCNVCQSDNPIYASITRFDVETGKFEIFAKGVRNSVGFDWHPQSGVLWFTDNGADWMGDDEPPCELNRAPRPGMDFGFPYCHGADIPDADFGALGDCKQAVDPAWGFSAHTAPLGMRFYTGKQFPEEYRHNIFVAQHGSWNRSTPIGYRVMRVRVENGKAISATPFVEGWLQQDKAWGRPVDVLVMADGSLLISDDKAGLIYRVTYVEK